MTEKVMIVNSNKLFLKIIAAEKIFCNGSLAVTTTRFIGKVPDPRMKNYCFFIFQYVPSISIHFVRRSLR